MAETETTEWQQTLAELDGLETEYEDEGWTTVTIQAGHTGIRLPAETELEDPELVYTVPSDSADKLHAAFDTGEFTQFTVYLDETRSPRYHVLELADPDRSLVVLIAGAVGQDQINRFNQTAQKITGIYTRFRRLNGTAVGLFRHDDPGVFFPE